MSSTVYSKGHSSEGNVSTYIEDSDIDTLSTVATQDWLLRHRLKSVEETWAEVLEDECGPSLVALLSRLRQLCAPDGQAKDADASPVLKLIEDLELSDAIKMSRAFALYFQLINIVEQHYEQRGQQQQYRAAYEDAAIASAERAASGETAAGLPAASPAALAPNAASAPKDNNGFNGQSTVEESLNISDN
ncbi:MAG: phosphoenolpyruvate carboxylase, partial [Cyanobacteria bacterium J06631_12]